LFRDTGQVGSLAGAAYLLHNNAGVLSEAQLEQKSRVEHKGKSLVDSRPSVLVRTVKAWPSDPLVPNSNVQGIEARGDRKITTGITGLWPGLKLSHPQHCKMRREGKQGSIAKRWSSRTGNPGLSLDRKVGRKVRTPQGSAKGNALPPQGEEQWNRENVQGYEPESGNGSFQGSCWSENSQTLRGARSNRRALEVRF